MKKLVMISGIAIMQAIIYILLLNIFSMPDTTTTDIIVVSIMLLFMLFITYNYMLKIIYEIQKIIKKLRSG